MMQSGAASTPGPDIVSLACTDRGDWLESGEFITVLWAGSLSDFAVCCSGSLRRRILLSAVQNLQGQNKVIRD